IILWLDSKGVYWVIDGATRLEIILGANFPADCVITVAVFTDISYEIARDMYIALNRTGVKQNTGELIHAYAKDYPQSLKNFVADPVWAMYSKRFGHLDKACKRSEE